MTSSRTVLIAIPCLKVGGTEVQTLHLVRALCCNGYNCVTVCYFEYDYTMVRRFEETGSKVICLSAYGTRPSGNRAVYRFLKDGFRRVLKEYHPRIAHVQYMAPGAIPIFVLKQLGIKIIIATLHTDACVYSSLRLIHFLQKRVVTAFTCVSETAEKGFFGSGNIFTNASQLSRHNHMTILNCLPPKYEFGNGKTSFSKPFTIGVVARLESIKGVDYVIPAFAKVLQSKPECRLLIVGEGKLRPMMEQQLQQCNIPAEMVEWVGRVDYEKLAGMYAQMDIVWVPSRSEGFGLSAVEAMAQGCAVVASRTGGLVEIIDDGNDGLLFNNGEPDDLAEKTLLLLNNTEKTQSISCNAIGKAKRYAFAHYSELINALYTKLQQ